MRCAAAVHRKRARNNHDAIEEQRKKTRGNENRRNSSDNVHHAVTFYTIKITTSDFVHAGTTNDILITLVGKDGTSIESRRSSCIFTPDFKKGATTVFDIEAPDIGVPLYIKLKLEYNVKRDAWACDEVIITREGEDVSYPVYDWISNEVYVASGEALIHTQEGDALRSLCSSEVDKAKVKFEWTAKPTQNDIGWGLPRCVNTTSSAGLPWIFRRSLTRVFNDLKAFVEGFLVNNFFNTLQSLSCGKPKSFDDFKQWYSCLDDGKDPAFIYRWYEDVEFGRQQLMGVSPLALKRCDFLPQCCNITESDVYGSLSPTSLQNEMEKGKIFIGDYSEVFRDIERNKGPNGETLYCPDAIGLFHVNGNGDLMPIAIQLIPNDPTSIFTPKCDYYDWLLAKMYYRTAAANIHQWYEHFFLTHSVMEPFSVAVFRNFPRSHPVYKLLRPHLQTVSAINVQARALLLPPDTKANQALAISGIEFVRSAFKTFRMGHLDFPKILKERGLDDSKILPKNYYRDDALHLWKVIYDFTSSILKIYYESDQDVEEDREIQDFAYDVATQGLGWQDGDTKDMPEHISSLDELIHLCTVLIYSSSVSHASVNFPQYEVYQFVPNCPASMRLPPHCNKEKATIERVLDSLPDENIGAIQIALTYLLSKKSPDELYIGEYPMNLFTDQEALDAIDKYRRNLEEYFQKVKERNGNAGDHAYKWLGKDMVPNSIAI